MKKLELTHDLVERLQRCVCPACKSQLTGRTQVTRFEVYGDGTHAIPEPGDTSLCLYCMTKLFFVDGGDGYLRVQKMTDAEYNDLPQFIKDALNVNVADLSEQAKQAEKEYQETMNLFAKWAKQPWR